VALDALPAVIDDERREAVDLDVGRAEALLAVHEGAGLAHARRERSGPGALEKVIPGGDFIQVKLGIPLAIIPIVIAASWQLAGFAMANFLAALGALSPELREAASLDGASWWQYQRHIALPLLWPMMIAVGIILAHVSLKSFDLVYAMAGQGPGFATDVPGIFVFEQTFRALRWNTGAAASVVMFILVSAVVLPYLYRRIIKEAR
jgi:glucose/mannose transport system permease protein